MNRPGNADSESRRRRFNLFAAVYSFVKEKISPDLTALLAVVALLLTGV
jgi:hypothetical protein